MTWIVPVILTGKFVRLEPLTEAHIPGLAGIGVGQDFWQFMLYGDMQTESDMRHWVLDILSRQGDVPFVAVHLASGRVAGATRYLNVSPKDRGLEIGGTWYGLEFQRTVVNTECKYLLLKHAFETLGVIRVQFKTDSRNVRSQKAIERIGGVKEGVLRNHMILRDGTILILTALPSLTALYLWPRKVRKPGTGTPTPTITLSDTTIPRGTCVLILKIPRKSAMGLIT